MDVLNSGMFSNLIGQGSTFSFAMPPLSKPQQNHMKLVFSTLAAGIVSTAGGVYFSFNYFALPSFVSLIVQLGAIFYVGATTERSADAKVRDPKRLAAFAAASFFTGCSLAPLLAYSQYVNPALVTHAFFITLSIFVCFFLAACYSTKRSMLYLGALLGSVSFYLSIVSLANIFLRWRIGHNIMLYGGLVLSVGYLYYFTQKTLVDFELGNRDFLLHGLQFYLELVSIFVRVLVILTEREQSKKRDDEKRRN